MSKQLGDFRVGDMIRASFNTRSLAGVPFTLAGSPALAVYKGNSTTESTAGVSSITVDFDSRTGHHIYSIDTSADGAFYATASDFRVVLTAGTVDGNNVANEEVACFSIENRSFLRPTAPGRTLDVSATGEAGLDWANVGSPTTAINLSGTTISNSQAVASVSGAVGSVTGAVGSVTGGVTVTTNNDKTGYALSSGERDTLANVLEAAILDEGDATALLAAIAAKVEEFLINEGDATATIAAIATAVNAAVTAAHGSGSYQTATGFSTLNAAGVRGAVGLGSANLDDQLAALPTAQEIRVEIDDFSETIAEINAEIGKIPRKATAIAAGAAATKTNTATTPNQTITEVIT